MIKLNKSDQEIIYKLAEKILGISQDGKYRKNILIRNIEVRILETKLNSLNEYLNFIDKNKKEYNHFISSITIHTTNWFREPPHFLKLENFLVKNIKLIQKKTFQILSAACSTGEEVYSLGLLFEKIRLAHPEFEYRIKANDVDPICINHAKNALFSTTELKTIPKEYYNNILLGKNKFDGFFTLSKEIRKRIVFSNDNLLKEVDKDLNYFDLIFCRNVLIYFEFSKIKKIISNLSKKLASNGVLCLGHSEALNNPKEVNLKLIWNSSYIVISPSNSNSNEKNVLDKRKNEKSLNDYNNKKQATVTQPKTILIIDDSPTVRKVLEKLYTKHGYEVIICENAIKATEIVENDNNRINLISLDLHMPELSGQEWLSLIRKKGIKIPVIVITDAHPNEAIEVLGALEHGAQDYLNKAELHKDENLAIERIQALIESKQQDSNHVIKKIYKNRQKFFRPELILLGASTGGPEAISRLLENFPKNSPPILMVQHIAPSFSEPFFKRICNISGLTQGIIEHHSPLQKGCLYSATADFHIGVKKINSTYHLIIDKNTGPVNRHRPSVDFLFDSAINFSDKIAGILLTGMGRDGAKGLSILKQKNAMTFIQDEDSCVVFGMPKEAIKLNAHGFVGNLSDIREQLNKILQI